MNTFFKISSVFLKNKFIKTVAAFLIVFSLTSCILDNIDDDNNMPKTDYSDFNFVLATEDASTADITRFFSFNLNEIDPEFKHDLISDNNLFVNSDPSTSSGHHFYKNFIFSMAKDKKGYSSTPGLFRLTLNTANRVFIESEIFIGKNNLFPSRKLCLVDEHTGFFYNEDIGQQTIQKFDPTTMKIQASLDLRPYIEAFRPEAQFQDEAGNNLVRTGSLVMDHINNKLLVSVVFIESAGFNLISESEENFYLAVIDIPTFSFEKIIQYHGAKTVGFFTSENNPTTKDEDGNLYFCSWGWNQFYSHNPSKIFRIKNNETEFDTEWIIDIESIFGEGRIAQSIASYNNKLYLHISSEPYYFASSEEVGTLSSSFMHFYEFDLDNPQQYRELAIPASNTASRINLFSILDDKLFICVPNSVEGRFNGVYSVNRAGEVKKEMTIDNKYRPTRLYKLSN